MRVFLPSDKEATGRAVVIFPGGGYSSLSMEKEGYDWAEYFQNQGIAAIVLKYRLPNGRPEVPVEDAEQALRLVRLNATSWKLNRNDVGVMGFSAGAVSSSTAAASSTDAVSSGAAGSSSTAAAGFSSVSSSAAAAGSSVCSSASAAFSADT